MPQAKTIKVTDQIRRAIETCGMTRYRIAKRSGIAESALTRFMSGERGLSAKALDKLGAVLNLQVTIRKSDKRKER